MLLFLLGAAARGDGSAAVVGSPGVAAVFAAAAAGHSVAVGLPPVLRETPTSC